MLAVMTAKSVSAREKSSARAWAFVAAPSMPTMRTHTSATITSAVVPHAAETAIGHCAPPTSVPTRIAIPAAAAMTERRAARPCRSRTEAIARRSIAAISRAHRRRRL
jgi:hypothetical protein